MDWSAEVEDRPAALEGVGDRDRTEPPREDDADLASRGRIDPGDSDQAAVILSEFPAEARADIVMRIAALDGVQPAAMQELNDIFERQLKGNVGAKSSSFGGGKCAANILNFVEAEVESKGFETPRPLWLHLRPVSPGQS